MGIFSSWNGGSGIYLWFPAMSGPRILGEKGRDSFELFESFKFFDFEATLLKINGRFRGKRVFSVFWKVKTQKIMKEIRG